MCTDCDWKLIDIRYNKREKLSGVSEEIIKSIAVKYGFVEPKLEWKLTLKWSLMWVFGWYHKHTISVPITGTHTASEKYLCMGHT